MYTTVYDVLSHPEQIQPVWGFYVVHFLLFGLGLLLGGIGVRAWRRKGLVFLAVCGFLAVICIFADYRDYLTFSQARTDIRNGRFWRVEGCLQRFHPGTSMGGRDQQTHESWRVGDVAFSYQPGQWGPGYSRTAGMGSLLNPVSRVRVSYIDYQDGPRIVRLDVLSNACPAAPDR